MVDSLTRALAQPLSGVLIGVIASILSAILAWVLYRKALPRSRLDYAYNDAVVLGNRYSFLEDELEIRFQGKIVPRVTSTIVAFWNNGNQTIYGSQVVDSDQLRIAICEGAQILRAYSFAATRPAVGCNVIVAESNDHAAIQFDFLDPGDGFGVTIIHSGSPGDAGVAGTLRGVKEGPRRLRHNRWVTLLTPIVAMLVVATAVSFLPSVATYRRESGLGAALSTGVLLGLIVLQVFSPLLLKRQRMRSFPKEMRKHPTLSGILPHLLDNT